MASGLQILERQRGRVRATNKRPVVAGSRFARTSWLGQQRQLIRTPATNLGRRLRNLRWEPGFEEEISNSEEMSTARPT